MNVIDSIVRRCALALRGLLSAPRVDHRKRDSLSTMAMKEGYMALPVDGGGPIDMLLIKRDERVVVLREECQHWPRQQIELVRVATDADVVWLPSDYDEQSSPELRRVHLSPELRPLPVPRARAGRLNPTAAVP